jgi:hypothetical protein
LEGSTDEHSLTLPLGGASGTPELTPLEVGSRDHTAAVLERIARQRTATRVLALLAIVIECAPRAQAVATYGKEARLLSFFAASILNSLSVAAPAH